MDELIGVLELVLAAPNWPAISAVAALCALLVSFMAWKTAASTAASTIQRAKARELRDGTALAVVIKSELQHCRGLIEHALPDQGEMPKRFATICNNRKRLELPILKSALASLGCFDSTISSALGAAYAKASLIHVVVPTEDTLLREADRHMTYIDGLSTEAVSLSLEAERLLGDFLKLHARDAAE